MPSLFVIQGRDQGQRFELSEPTISVGRVATNTVQLHDHEVSREHAELRLLGDSYVLRDLESSNGTFVNGQRVAERRLGTGDQIQLGRTLLLFTGIREGKQDLAEQVRIVADHAESDDGSRIVHAIGQPESSELFDFAATDSSSPWLARARSNLQIMYRTALAVSHTLDIDELLTRIMDMIFEWVDADRGCIMLRDEEGQLTPKARRHRRGVQGSDRISISKTILDYVEQHNEGVLTSDARDDQRWDPAHSIVRLGVREAICVPMQGRYGVVGVIYIDTSIPPQHLLKAPQSTKFSQDHLKLMIAIAHQAALAVEDTSYYQAMVQAERLAAVGQAIASLSHHIKNILQGVRGGSYLIELGLQDHQRAIASESIDRPSVEKSIDTMLKGWKIVERNQERISALVLDMLTFSKEREPDPEPANLNDVVGEVVELMRQRAAELEVELTWRPLTNMPELMFDPEAIHRAVLNVVTNAIDACEDRDPARVEVATLLVPDGSQARIVVRDTGTGIAPDDLERIFTMFVSNKGGRGTGLGLPVSRKILQEHGGEIRVHSTPGQGSLFTLEFPARRPPAEESSSALGETFAPE